MTVWDGQPEYVESWLNNAGNKRGWSGSQVRLTRLELNIYRTGHFRPLAPNPSTPPRAAPRDLGRSRAISGDLGAAPRYLGRSRSVARAASHLLKKEGGWRQEPGGHAPSRAPSSPGFWPPGRRPTVAARGSRPSDGATTPRPARSPLHPAIAARAPSAAEFFPRASLGPRQRRRTSRPPTCAAITAVIVGAAPLWRLCISRARLPRLMPRPNQLPGWCQGSKALLSLSPPSPLSQLSPSLSPETLSARSALSLPPGTNLIPGSASHGRVAGRGGRGVDP